MLQSGKNPGVPGTVPCQRPLGRQPDTPTGLRGCAVEGGEGSSHVIGSIQETFIIEILRALGSPAPRMQGQRHPRSSP